MRLMSEILPSVAAGGIPAAQITKHPGQLQNQHLCDRKQQKEMAVKSVVDFMILVNGSFKGIISQV